MTGRGESYCELGNRVAVDKIYSLHERKKSDWMTVECGVFVNDIGGSSLQKDSVNKQAVKCNKEL